MESFKSTGIDPKKADYMSVFDLAPAEDRMEKSFLVSQTTNLPATIQSNSSVSAIDASEKSAQRSRHHASRTSSATESSKERLAHPRVAVGGAISAGTREPYLDATRPSTFSSFISPFLRTQW